MKKGSEDIRSLAVRNVLAGKYSIAQVAEMTGYSMATIYKGTLQDSRQAELPFL